MLGGDLSFYTKGIIKKTRRGKIRKISKEIYVRDQILCGVSCCELCYGSHLNITKSTRHNIVFPNFDVLNKYSDFILEDESLTHVVIPYSVLEYLGDLNKSFINKLKNKTRSLFNNELPLFCNKECQDFDKKIKVFKGEGNQYIQFPDAQFTETLLGDLNNLISFEEIAGNSLIKTIKWYLKHFSASEVEYLHFYLICEDTEWNVKFNNNLSFPKLTILNPYAFVKQVSNYYPNAGEKLPAENLLTDGKGFNLQETFLFPEHLSYDEMKEGLNRGQLFKGVIKMISRDSGEVEITDNGNEFTINVKGHLNLNRCINGDIVVVKLDCLTFINNNDLSAQIKNELEIDQVEELEDKEIAGMGRIVLLEDDYDENSALKLQNLDTEDIRPNLCEKVNIQTRSYSGRVVGILKRNWSEYCGSLIPLNSNDNRYNICYNSSSRQHRIFVPIDLRIPKIIIHTKLSSTLEYQRLVVVIDDWDRSSFYPTGHWISVLGKAGDLETETSVILRSRSINFSEFSPKVLQCLPNHGRNIDWVPTHFDLKDRVDLRDKLVFSVDPPGCKDIDDALSIELINSNDKDQNNKNERWYNLGVHIADVSHFVRPNTPIDEEASRRCNTCYLVNRRIDMLPEELTTNICSLVSNKDRLAFSCNWEISENAEIRKFYFRKSIINSKYSFTYLQAQNIIDDSEDSSEIALSLRKLLNISKILRKNRIDRGAIELSSSEVKIDFEEFRNQDKLLDKNGINATSLSSVLMNIKDVSMYLHLSTNSMVEEFMLLANITVAKYILEHFPNCSLLRRHPEPKYDQLEKLEKMLTKIGFENFKYDTSRNLSKSLNEINTNELVKKNPIIEKLIRILTTRTMNQAVYFTTGKSVEGMFHYGLAEEIYTHFTSPIRRYADIIVHRLLSASIGLETLDETISNKEKMLKLCQTLNTNKRNAQMAGRDSTKLFIYLFCKQHGNQEVNGIIIQIREDSVSVFIPRFGFEGLAPIDPNIYLYDPHKPCLKKKFKESETLNLFDTVKVSIYVSDENFQNKIMINITPDK